MKIEAIINSIGLLGLGGVVGILVKSFLDRKAKKQELLFEARVHAYKYISGRMLNLFNELDLNSLPEPVRVSKIHNLLSELYLLGSKDSIKLLGPYKEILFKFHNALEKNTENEAHLIELHAKLSKYTGMLHAQMRKDIFIHTSDSDYKF